MIRVALVSLMLFVTTPAQAYSCSDVRSWLAQYGAARLLIMAKLYGLSADQIRQAKACVGRK